jgi:hypothetical protein
VSGATPLVDFLARMRSRVEIEPRQGLLPYLETKTVVLNEVPDRYKD